MTSHYFSRSLVILSVLLGALQLSATPRMARVKADRTNVRAKPSFDGEVLLSLKKGEVVEVLEEAPGLGVDGKPREWSKISLPSRVAIWVYGPLLDASSKKVKSATVHLRAGPGKNYSELGEIPRGQAVNVIREMEDWVQVDPPPGLVAYVASSLLTNDSTAPPPVELSAPIPVTTSEPRELQTAPSLANSRAVNAPETTSRPTIAPTATETLSNTPSQSPPLDPLAQGQPVAASSPETGAASPNAGPPEPSASSPSPAMPSGDVPAVATTTVLSTPAAGLSFNSSPSETTAAREVHREGIVRRAWNIQAPGYFELRSVRGEGILNFLVAEDPTVDIKYYLGRVVSVTGTEWRDRRWKTPLIKVTAIQLAQ